MTTREERLAIANKVIEIIGSHGRKFLRSRDGTLTTLDLEKGRVYVTDNYTKKRFRADPDAKWSSMGFSNGGTIRGLLERLAAYVEDGKPIHFGVPRMSYGDMWGYGEEAIQVVEKEVLALLGYEPRPIATPE